MKHFTKYLAVVLLMPMMAFGANIPKVGSPGSRLPGLDDARWKGRMSYLNGTYDYIKRLFRPGFEELNDKQKECLKARMFFLQTAAYFHACPSSFEMKSKLGEDKNFAKMLQDRWCSGPNDPGMKLWDAYKAHAGESAIKDLTQGRAEWQPVQIPKVDSKTMEQLAKEAEHNSEVRDVMYFIGLGIAVGAGGILVF